MQQADSTVLSLRPGGGRGGGSRLFALSSSSFTSSADLPLTRPHASFSLKVRSFASLHSLLRFLNHLFFGSRYTYPTAVAFVITIVIILYLMNMVVEFKFRVLKLECPDSWWEHSAMGSCCKYGHKATCGL